MRCLSVALSVLAPWLAACEATTAPVSQVAFTTVTAPAAPRAENGFDAALVESVRAYLATFELDETHLKAGLTIPFSYYGYGGGDRESFGDLPLYLVGAARATGEIGPGGHQVYEVIDLHGASRRGLDGHEHGAARFLEIAPEPGKVTGR